MHSANCLTAGIRGRSKRVYKHKSWRVGQYSVAFVSRRKGSAVSRSLVAKPGFWPHVVGNTSNRIHVVPAPRLAIVQLASIKLEGDAASRMKRHRAIRYEWISKRCETSHFHKRRCAYSVNPPALANGAHDQGGLSAFIC